MTAPTRNVTVKLFDAHGNACPDGTTVTARLDQTDVYQGFVVPTVFEAETTDGIAVVPCFPNHPTTGLGTTGSKYTFYAAPSGWQPWRVEEVQVPDQDCDLDTIANLTPAPSLSAAEAAQASAVQAAATATVKAAEAADAAAAAQGDAQQTASDRVQTGADRIQTGIDRSTVEGIASSLGDLQEAVESAQENAEATAEDVVATSNALASTIEQGAVATAAALRAQQAVDAAGIAGNMFEDTTTGLANTSASGDTDRYFTVPVEDSDTALILYINDGGVAREITRYASVDSGVETALDLIDDETDGIAIDATTSDTAKEVVIRDTGTPANDYQGSLFGFFPSTVFPGMRLCVQEDGSLKWQQHQLLTGAKLFDSGAYWAATSTTVTALTAEDDGEVPYEMAATSTTSRLQQNHTVFADEWYSFECVVKAGTSDRCYLTANTDGSNPRAYFLLSGDGSVTSESGDISGEIYTDDVDGRPLPSGRYRIVARFKTAGTALNMALGQCDADASTDVTSGRTLKVYRSHLYRGVKSLEFLDSVASAVRGVPYDWTNGYRALLVEGVITNYRSKWGDDLTQADWVNTNITAALDFTGPHGEPCSTITADAANGTILQTTATASTVHTMTAWVKRKTGTGKLYAQINGDTQEVTGITTTEWKRVKYTRTGASAVAEFGLKIETSSDAFYVSLCKCADQAFATSDLPTQGDVPTTRVADVLSIPLTRFPSGAAMTAYFDLVTADDLNTGGLSPGFVGASDFSVITEANDSIRMYHSVSASPYFQTLMDFEPGGRIEATLRIDTENHAASANGFGAGYDDRPGAPSLTSLTFGGDGGQLWLRRLMVVPEALPDNALERWKYSGAGRDERYLDDVLVARNAETAEVTCQREPAIAAFYDRADEAGGYVIWLERNVNPNPSHIEFPYRLRGRSWTLDKVAMAAGQACLSLGAKQTIVEPTDWDTGYGHIQSPTIVKQTVGAEKGRVWVIYTQLDSPDGTYEIYDHRRVYALYSDDNMVTLSTPQMILDPGIGAGAYPSPAGNIVEFPADSAHPGRLVFPYYLYDETTGGAPAGMDNIGVMYRDPGGSWTQGGTVDIASANEQALALWPNGVMLMTARTETVDQLWQARISGGGSSFSTPELFGSGEFTNVSLSLSQMDPGGEDGALGRMLLVGTRVASPVARSGLSVEELEGSDPVELSGTQFRPLGTQRSAGYCSSRALTRDGLMLIAYEDGPGNSFNNWCSIRMMLVRP